MNTDLLVHSEGGPGLQRGELCLGFPPPFLIILLRDSKVWPSERQLKEATSAERSDDDNQDAESPKISKPGIYDISASELRRGVCANCR